jgi:anti-sigma regulatory factor (Ser/Thr protein kinase)
VENEHSQKHRSTADCSAPEEGVSSLPSSGSAHASREILSLEVKCGSRAPAFVRMALGQIEGLGPARDDVILVASELVTNAVVHSGGSPADTIQVRAVLTRTGVSISVQDSGLSGDSPRLQEVDALAAGGRGLRIVKQIAHRWGFEHDRGHRVWAELHLPTAMIDLDPGS